MVEIDSRGIVAIALAAGAATLVALLLYRRTSPTLPLRLRLILGSLRWLAAFMMLALVLDPSLSLTTTRSAAPQICVLIDDSKSMAYPDSTLKLNEAKSALSDAFIRTLGDKAQLRFFTFSDTVGEASFEKIRTIAGRGSRTDLVAGIARAVKSYETKPSALVLVSDGGVNFGEDALHYCSTLKIPIYALSVARDAHTPDISIDRLETPDAAYAGSEAPLAIYASGRNPGTISTTLTISDSTGEVFRTSVSIPGNGASEKIAAKVQAGATGLHSFKASLAPFAGEPVVANNSMAFSLKVMKGKIRVLLVAPHPSWDFAFARRILEADPNIELAVDFSPGSPQAIKSAGTTRDLKRAISNSDVAVILRGSALGQEAQELERFVWRGGGALLISPDASGDVAEAMNPLVVERTSKASGVGRGVPSLYSPVLAESGAGHEIMDIDVAGGGRLWSSLPPLPVDASITGTKPDATVLIRGLGVAAAGGNVPAAGKQRGPGESRSEAREVPLAAAMRHGMGRVAAFGGYDLWRWDLVPKGFGAEASAFSQLLSSSIRWLVETEETKRLAISTTKSDYLWGEPVAITARVVDENLKPVAGAAVETRIINRSRGTTVLESKMLEKSAGNHSQVVDLLPRAAYTVKATATLGGKVYAEDAAQFIISDRGLEDSDFDGDFALLDEIARATGGRSYTAATSSGLPGDLNPGSVVVRTSKDLRLRLTLATFVVLACLLATEWFIRRSKMLA